MCSRFREPLLLVVVAILTACQHNSPNAASDSAQSAALPVGNRQTELMPGKGVQLRSMRNPYEGNDEAIGEGQKLYKQFNCSGCHFRGGGGIGPPLMDDAWIYGSSSSNVYWTIVEGRPNGMPSFGGRIVDDQVWKIAAYVRSLSGLRDEAQNQGTPSQQK